MSSPGLDRVNSQDQALYWTDDIPVCHESAVGQSNNQIYRDNAPSRREEHECEDSSFRFRPETDNEIFLYGVFDGHNGNKLSNFAAQRFPAEILLGQLGNNLNDDEEILNVLHQAFVSVEKAYLDSISDQLAQKCNLREQLHAANLKDVSSPEALQLYEDVMRKMDQLDSEIAGGTSGVLALIIKNKLYVANVGSCRALLCKTDAERILRVHQLTMEHNLLNPEEIQRLAELGIDTDKLRATAKHPYTRSLGDFNVKIGYKDMDVYSSATSEPVIAEPELSHAIELDENCRFLILMSSGVYKSLESAGGANVNVTIAGAVAGEFAVQSTLSGVAQGVVDKIARTHHDAYVTNSDGRRREICSKREDMTLLLRNFNYSMPNSVGSPASGVGSPARPVHFTSPMGGHQQPLSVLIPSSEDATEEDDFRPMFTLGGPHSVNTNTFASTQRSYTNYTSSNDSTQSGDDTGRLFAKKSTYKNPLPLDEDGRIKAYISFKGFTDALDKLTDEEREKFDEEAEPKPAYETIPEEKEMLSPGATSPQPHGQPLLNSDVATTG